MKWNCVWRSRSLQDIKQSLTEERINLTEDDDLLEYSAA
jgi:hypothetical protein